MYHGDQAPSGTSIVSTKTINQADSNNPGASPLDPQNLLSAHLHRTVSSKFLPTSRTDHQNQQIDFAVTLKSSKSRVSQCRVSCAGAQQKSTTTTTSTALRNTNASSMSSLNSIVSAGGSLFPLVSGCERLTVERRFSRSRWWDIARLV